MIIATSLVVYLHSWRIALFYRGVLLSSCQCALLRLLLLLFLVTPWRIGQKWSDHIFVDISCVGCDRWSICGSLFVYDWNDSDIAFEWLSGLHWEYLSVDNIATVALVAAAHTIFSTGVQVIDMWLVLWSKSKLLDFQRCIFTFTWTVRSEWFVATSCRGFVFSLGRWWGR